MAKGFVVICGGEGSGKSTQVRRLLERYPDKVVISREPGGSPFGEAIRNVALNHELSRQASPQTMFGLMWASRHDHIKHLIIPQLMAGKCVVSDRFDSCSYAYQVHGQECHALEELFWHMREVFLGECVPECYIFFDVEPKIGLARAAARRGFEALNHFDQRSIGFHERIRSGYQSFLTRVPHVVIDANRPLEEVSVDFDREMAPFIT